MSLALKSVSGTIWTLVDIFLNKAIYFVATLILARLLGPSEFGLVGMIMLFFTVGTTLVDSGLSVSLIRTAEPDEVEYSTVFYLNLFMSIVAYLLIYLIAPFVAVFYEQPVLEALIRVYCLGFVINAFRMVPQSRLLKEMNFKKIAVLNIPGNIIGLYVGIWMALHNYQVWSIVGLYLSTQLTATFMYWGFVKWKPRLVFSFVKMRVHWNFGYKLMLSAQLNTIFDNIYNILIGRFYSVQDLGYYERAYTLNNYPVSVLSGIINKVSLPMFSHIAGEKQRTLEIYRKTMLLAFFISAPLMLGAIVMARPLFVLFLGNQWLPAVPFFQILCLTNMFYPIHSLSINILSVFGRSDFFLKLEILKKIVIVIFVLISINFGIYGLVWSSVASSFFALYLNSHYSQKVISYKFVQQLKDLIPILIISVFTAATMFLFMNLLSIVSEFIQIVLTSCVGVLFYLLISHFTKSESLISVIGLIKTRI